MNFSEETIGAARELADASIAALSLRVNCKQRARNKAARRIHLAYMRGWDAGLSPDEMAVLQYASHPWCPDWIKRYVAGPVDQEEQQRIAAFVEKWEGFEG